MRVNYDLDKLKEILTDLSLLTGISIVFLDVYNNYICDYKKDCDFCSAIQSCLNNRKLCASSDQKLLQRCKESGKYEYHICHSGLYDAAMPIKKDGVVVGYILMGRIRSSNSPKKYFNSKDSYLSKLYNELPFFTDRQLESLRTLLSNILFSNAIEIEYDKTIEAVSNYIKDNLSNDLTVNSICSEFFISKNYLYKSFKNYYNCTVNEYITELRLEKAKLLLRDTKEPIYSICEQVGIDNYTYFSKLFKKKANISPTFYRKQNNH